MISTEQSLSSKTPPITHLWTRLTSNRMEDSWIEKLKIAGPEALVIKAFPASRTLRLQVYTDEAMALSLFENFGGSIRPFNAATWTPPVNNRLKPLRFAGRLSLYNDEASFLEDQKKAASKRSGLLIPAGMAFGTGDHATTSSCLRLLNEITKPFIGQKWSLLDLGTGSGVLALAGELWGANTILGIDFDERCVAISQENAVKNQLSKASFLHADLLSWNPPGVWDVITANIYSSVLTTVAAKIVQALTPKGHLILSGILAVEKEMILATFLEQGMKPVQIIKRGKWCALHLVRL